jgi:hypothetical protein
MSDEPQPPATKADLERLEHKIDLIEPNIRNYILERENGMIWKLITLQLAVVGGIAAAQFGLIYFILTHWKP